MTLHKYLYANGNSVMFKDPSGLMGIIDAVATMGLERNLRNIEWTRKVRSTRRKFRGYCRWAAKNVQIVIKEYNELRKMTSKTKYASHHILQDWAMKAYFGAQYYRGFGMCMPVLGNRGQRFSPHWILNQVQKKHKSSKDITGVAKIGLKAAGCRDQDAKKILEFLKDSWDLAEELFGV